MGKLARFTLRWGWLGLFGFSCTDEAKPSYCVVDKVPEPATSVAIEYDASTGAPPSVLPNGRTVKQSSLDGAVRVLDHLQLGRPVDMVAHPDKPIVYVADARFHGGTNEQRCSRDAPHRGIHVLRIGDDGPVSQNPTRELQGPNQGCKVELPCPPSTLVGEPYVCPPEVAEPTDAGPTAAEPESEGGNDCPTAGVEPICPLNVQNVRATMPYDGAFGLAITAHGDYLYASTGISGYVLQFPIDENGQLKPAKAVQVGGFTAGLTLSPDETSLFVVRFLGNSATVESSVAEIGLAPSVAEIAALDAGDLAQRRFELLETDLKLEKAGAYNCVAIKEGDTGVRLWVSGFRDGTVQSAARTNPGLPFGQLTTFDVGKNPEGLATLNQDVIVAVSDEDKLVRLKYNADLKSIQLVASIPVGAQISKDLLGASPSQLMVDADDAGTYAYAYVALSMDDAVSVVDLQQKQEIGEISVGQSPSAVAKVATGTGRKFVVANGKTPYGPQLPAVALPDVSVPQPRDLDACWVEGKNNLDETRIGIVACVNGSPSSRPDVERYGYYDPELDQGTVTIVADTSPPVGPALRDLAVVGLPEAQSHVTDVSGTFTPDCGPDQLFPIPLPGSTSPTTPLQHVFLVVRENKTYDFLLGDLEDDDGSPRGNGDPRYAVDYIRKARGWPPITPNLHGLAKRFTSLDNFYADAELSTQGHSWSTSSFVNDYLERIHLEEDSRFFGYAFDQETGLSASEPGFGSFFMHLLRKGVPFKIYGEGIGLIGHVGDDYVVNHANVGGPYGVQDKRRSDIDKVEALSEELRNAGEWPAFTYVLLPRDHTLGTDPGSPSPVSMIAENDVATGNLVDAISHIDWLWKSSVIFIVEDDAAQGYDHVDYHRSICLVVSPWAKHGYNSSVHASYPALYHTIERILGVSPMNRLDGNAPTLWDAFVADPSAMDASPFQATCSRVPLDAVNPTECAPQATSERLQSEQGNDEFDHRPDVDRAVWDLVTGSELGTGAPL